jgi:hypothetical protein
LLPDELIETLLNYNTFAGGSDIDSVIVARRGFA